MIEQETKQRYLCCLVRESVRRFLFARLEQAEQRAKREAAEKLEREKKYKEEQERETKRLQSLKQKQKEVGTPLLSTSGRSHIGGQEFEEKENVMQKELEKRMEIERQIQAEMDAKRKAV